LTKLVRYHDSYLILLAWLFIGTVFAFGVALAIASFIVIMVKLSDWLYFKRTGMKKQKKRDMRVFSASATDLRRDLEHDETLEPFEDNYGPTVEEEEIQSEDHN